MYIIEIVLQRTSIRSELIEFPLTVACIPITHRERLHYRFLRFVHGDIIIRSPN